MKLATYKDGSRDGHLVVVSRDLTSAHYASGIATRLQQVLDDWNFLSPQLQDLYTTLNHGRARHAFTFEPRQCMAPLPRTYRLAHTSAYVNLLELTLKARGIEIPENLCDQPLMTHGPGDTMLGPCDPIVGDEAWGIDFEAGIAAVTGDVGMGCTPGQGLESVRLLMLANVVSLRDLMPAEPLMYFGFLQGKLAAAFSPVAVTPDELGEAWQHGRLHLTLQTSWNGRTVGLCDAGGGKTFHFGQLIAHLCRTQEMRAGSIVATGAVADNDASRGYSCILQKRAMETVEDGAPKTAYMQAGDALRIEMKGSDGASVFGPIEQQVVSPATQAAENGSENCAR
ncbi:MAG TPA: fumarylacetoacetate hydrolase family protein [Burkholderiaceae bacterium]|nr:fumarylacetoacetate hydrolase family protein [Burkholderiaceae bacterium]